MIYTCTLNPSVDYVLRVQDFQLGGLNRGTESFYYPGGKGINVSRVLKRLGVENTALGFLGGFTGSFIRQELEKENIQHQFVEISGTTRINMKLKADEETELNGPGIPISKQQMDELFEEIQRLQEGDYLVAAGSIPSSIPDDIYLQIAHECQKKGVNLVADTSSAALKALIGTKLFLVKPNHHELGELFDTSIESQEDAIHYAKELQQKGAENVIISMGGDGAIFVSDTETYVADVPKGKVKNTVGSGDSMVAGFVASYIQHGDKRKAFQQAVASGSATAFSDDLCTSTEVASLLEQVRIQQV
ncbi:1-phosphofructokinase [Radiobacillus kanasensis]|uniref:1-phosphofructokinase n=1 Tax=Radiobacillus kanasensis TaxID=2844358 RepID=UPI001E2972C5|nr:1-phosphofructokinase [Radiobacillus kanasensis]UFT98457.1 1-phosphofructokinase [Radiobacillus kanasensis]